VFVFQVRCLIIVLLFLPNIATAQRSLDIVTRDMKPDEKVRVHSSSGFLEGRFVGYTNNPQMLRLRVEGDIVPVARIDSLWVHHNNVKKGAIIGGLVAAAGSAAGLVYLCQTDDDGCDGAMVAGLAAGPVVVGALIGGLLGAAGSGWDLRYAQASMSFMATPLPRRRVGAGVSMSFSFGMPFLRR